MPKAATSARKKRTSDSEDEDYVAEEDEAVGERCRKLKFFLWFHQDPSMSSSKQRVKGEMHLHTKIGRAHV